LQGGDISSVSVNLDITGGFNGDLSITRLKSVAYKQNAANACFTKEC
jgi:hypothetical protein